MIMMNKLAGEPLRFGIDSTLPPRAGRLRNGNCESKGVRL
jgi:hypothetical protein